MTKVIILGEDTPKTGKKIEFLRELNIEFEFECIKSNPYDWDNIELICKNYEEVGDNGTDLMFAYDVDRSLGVLFLGHFNDGIV